LTSQSVTIFHRPIKNKTTVPLRIIEKNMLQNQNPDRRNFIKEYNIYFIPIPQSAPISFQAKSAMFAQLGMARVGFML